MSLILTPATPAELAEAVRSAPRVLASGAGTKERLSRVCEDGATVRISTARLSGLVEYEPDEYTFTALAGTPLREIEAALAARGQYLPFDPLLAAAGATLGGTLAAGLSGPGRYRFGGVRDFVLGVQFADGTGRLLRMGGKVVKNAAGFDLPKFFAGSLGRFGAFAALTFKVFPLPAARVTLVLEAETRAAALEILTQVANTRWEPEAVDIAPGSHDVLVRLAGPPDALSALSAAVLAKFRGRMLSPDAAAEVWDGLRECRHCPPGGVLLKVPLSPGRLLEAGAAFDALPGAQIHVSAGGNVVLLSLPAGTPGAAVETTLTTLRLPALTLRGDAPLQPGVRPAPAITAAVKAALDPDHRFPTLDD